MSKKNLPPSSSEPALETRRDVMRLSLAVAAFGAAMGIAGPSVAAVKRRREGPKGDGDHGLVRRRRGPKVRDDSVSTKSKRRHGPKGRSGSDAQ